MLLPSPLVKVWLPWPPVKALLVRLELAPLLCPTMAQPAQTLPQLVRTLPLAAAAANAVRWLRVLPAVLHQSRPGPS